MTGGGNAHFCVAKATIILPVLMCADSPRGGAPGAASSAPSLHAPAKFEENYKEDI